MSVARKWRVVRNLHPLALPRSPWREAAAPSNSQGSRWVAEDSTPWPKAMLSLLIIQRQKLDGIHCSIACHWISPGSTWPLARGSPKEQQSASCQSSTGLTTGQAWLWELEAHGAAQLVPRQGHPTASKPHLTASPRETSIPAWFAHVLLSDPPPTY